MTNEIAKTPVALLGFGSVLGYQVGGVNGGLAGAAIGVQVGKFITDSFYDKQDREITNLFQKAVCISVAGYFYYQFSGAHDVCLVDPKSLYCLVAETAMSVGKFSAGMFGFYNVVAGGAQLLSNEQQTPATLLALGGAFGSQIGGLRGVIAGALSCLHLGKAVINRIYGQKECERLSLSHRGALAIAGGYYYSLCAGEEIMNLEGSSSWQSLLFTTALAIGKYGSVVFGLYHATKGGYEYFNEDQLFKRWLVDDKSVQVIKKGVNTLARVYDKSTAKLEKEFDYGKLYLGRDQYFKTLESGSVVLLNGQKPCFLKPFYVWEDSPCVTLLKINDMYILQVQNRWSGVSIFAKFEPEKIKFPRFTCDKTWSELSNIDKTNHTEVIKACQAMRIRTTDANDVYDSNESTPIAFRSIVVFEPQYFPSKIDFRFNVSHNYWGVTMIRVPKNFKEPTYLQRLGIKDGQHAVLIFEGVISGKYVMKQAHLVNNVDAKNQPIEGEGRVQASEITYRSDRLEWDGRTSVFKRSVEKIQHLLDKIRDDDKKIFKLNPYVKQSKLDEEENCYTWARENLKELGIEIGDDSLDVFVCSPWSKTYGKVAFKDTPYPDPMWEFQNNFDEEKI